jgi:signal transduction histidine kinase
MTSHFNPRFGVDRTFAFVLDRLKNFYGAKFSLMVLNDSSGENYSLQRTGNSDPEETAHFDPVDPELGRRLMSLPPECAAVFNAKYEEWWRPGRSDQLLDITLGRTTKTDRLKLATLAATLDAKSFLTAPVRYRGKGIGRLYVVSERSVFIPSDMSFLVAVLERLNPLIENTRLVELLSSHAADDERLKIARNIHDSVIQPYFALHMGLEALHENAEKNFPALSRQIEQLMQSAENGIDDLRRYVAGLKQSPETDGGLLPAMRRFAARFSETTGIAVDIETEGDIHANERLAAELFQMMTEGLSNIRKHTHAMHAKVRVSCRLGHFILEIKNEGYRGFAAPFFTPASISERTAALGGKVRVSKLPDGGNAVIVDIPL